MTRQEGSQIFDFGQDESESPWLARARSNLQVMYRTALAVSHTLDIDQLLSRIMELIFEWVEADRGCVMLVNQDTKQLEPRVRKIRKGVSSDDKISRAEAKLVKSVGKKCDDLDEALALDTVFAGSCGDPDLSNVEDCVIAAARCQACLKIDAFDDLNLDCDQADDQNANGSCP